MCSLGCNINAWRIGNCNAYKLYVCTCSKWKNDLDGQFLAWKFIGVKHFWGETFLEWKTFGAKHFFKIIFLAWKIIVFFLFQDFLGILSKVSRGSIEEKLQWVFGLYDLNGDGCISKSEMTDVVSSIYEMLGRATVPLVEDSSAKEHVEKIFHVSK